MKKTNYSIQHKKYLKKEKRKKIIIHFLRIILLIGFFAIWELLARYEVIDVFFTSSPSRVYLTFCDLIENGNMLYHIKVTLLEAIASFLIATSIGSLVAIILWWNTWVRKVLEPYIIVLNALPKIALGPIIIIWAGAGYSSIITMAVLISVIITTIDMLNGFNNVDKDKILLLKSMSANKFQILNKLILPANRSTLIAVLKINVGLSWVGTIMGEYLTSKAGLGYLLVYGGQVFQLDLVMTSTVVLCVLAGLMYLGVALLEKYLNKKSKKFSGSK